MLTQLDFENAASRLRCSVAAIKAVCEVEAPRGGFLSTGEPTILFERHIFSRLTQHRYDHLYPDISNRTPGGYGTLAAQHSRLLRATRLNREAALMSASWGRFQILGENYKQAGFSSIQGFINAMYTSEQRQLDAFVAFILADSVLISSLRLRNWAAFARRYNGPNYAINQYDRKLAAAYFRYA